MFEVFGVERTAGKQLIERLRRSRTCWSDMRGLLIQINDYGAATRDIDPGTMIVEHCNEDASCGGYLGRWPRVRSGVGVGATERCR